MTCAVFDNITMYNSLRNFCLFINLGFCLDGGGFFCFFVGFLGGGLGLGFCFKSM